MSTHWRKRQYGYTLLELLLAIGIGVMAVFAIWAAWEGLQLLGALVDLVRRLGR